MHSPKEESDNLLNKSNFSSILNTKGNKEVMVKSTEIMEESEMELDSPPIQEIPRFENKIYIDRYVNKELINVLQTDQKSHLGYRLSNLSDIIQSKEFHHLCPYFKKVFIDIYNYSRSLQTINSGLNEEIKRLSGINHHLYKSQKFKEKMLQNLTEQNRILEEKKTELHDEINDLNKIIKRRNFERNTKSMFDLKPALLQARKTFIEKKKTVIIEEDVSEETTPVPKRKSFIKQRTSFINGKQPKMIKKLPDLDVKFPMFSDSKKRSNNHRNTIKSRRFTSIRSKKRKSSMAHMLTAQRSHRTSSGAKKNTSVNSMIIMHDDKSIPSLIFKKFMVKDLMRLNEEEKQIIALLMENNDNFNFLRNLVDGENFEHFLDTSGKVARAKIKGTVTALLVRNLTKN